MIDQDEDGMDKNRFLIYPDEVIPIGRPKRIVDLTTEEDKQILAETDRIRREVVEDGEKEDWS